MDAPDYDLADSLLVDSQEQHRALGNLTRHRILGLLLDRAMTGAQLAEALGVLKGSVGFHLRTLEQAGLVREVRTRKVRGATERYFGRTARRYELEGPDTPSSAAPMLLRTVAAELDRVVQPGAPTDIVSTTRARLDPARAAEFRDRIGALVEEFRVERAAGAPGYALAVAFYRAEPAEAAETAKPAETAETAGPAGSAGERQ